MGRELQGDQYYEERSIELAFGKIWGWGNDNEVSTLRLQFSHLQNEYTYYTLYLIVFLGGILSTGEQLNL